MPHPRTFQFDHALVRGDWLSNPQISVVDGIIVSISSPDTISESSALELPKSIERIKGIALPGMINLHSHSFQRGLAGLSEYKTANQDSFWTWRTLMYDFVSSFDPEDVYRVSKQLYAELLRGGYTTVGEFHYLHTDKQGHRYNQIHELSSAIGQAAIETGINLCWIPTLYQQGGFGRSLEPKQKRFYLNEDQFFELIDQAVRQFGAEPNFQIALALHSLRAVEVPVGKSVIERFCSMHPKRPIHMHVAEQVGEVEECLAATGKRSIEYLFDQYAVDEKWCLIHCTQAESHELKMIADSNCVIGLCPTTEANLGDGIFPAGEFLSLGGRWGIGTDSQVSANFSAELRMLEYSQRLLTRRRNVLSTENKSVGRNLFCLAAQGGAQAMGIRAGNIEVGNRADLIVVNSSHPSIGGAEGDRLIDRLIFCDYGNPIERTMVGGRWVG